MKKKKKSLVGWVTNDWESNFNFSEYVSAFFPVFHFTKRNILNNIKQYKMKNRKAVAVKITIEEI